MFLCPEKFCWTNALDVCREIGVGRSLASLVAGLTERSGPPLSTQTRESAEDREAKRQKPSRWRSSTPISVTGQPAGASGGGDRKKAAFRSDPRSVGLRRMRAAGSCGTVMLTLPAMMAILVEPVWRQIPSLAEVLAPAGLGGVAVAAH